MYAKWINFRFFVVFVITSGLSDDKINDVQMTKREAYEEKLKLEYGCNPPDQYKLIKQNSDEGYVKDICLPNSYQITESPEIDTYTDVVALIHEKRILEINERKKSITLLISLWLFWEDKRIHFNHSNHTKDVSLPDITTTRQYIWIPISMPTIDDIRELLHAYYPILAPILYSKGKFANPILSMEQFVANATVLTCFPTWKAKIFL